MPTGFRIRPYAPVDEGPLLAVWNEAMWADRIDAPAWRSRVLLDPNFVAEGCPVAEDAQGRLVGFMLALARQVPYFTDGLQREQGWITAFGVRPEARRGGVGTALLEHACAWLRASGARQVDVASYVPNYVLPGVDVAAYADALAFLERRGFRTLSRPLSMRAEISAFRLPPEIAEAQARLAAEGIIVDRATAGDIVPVRQFLQRCFSWDWVRFAGEIMEALFAGDPRQVGLLTAKRRGEIVGYAQFRGERFGPFGVDPALRGRGVGRVLLAETLLDMRARGFHCAWFLWTSDHAARLYARCGFREARRFAVMRRDLTPGA